MLQWFTAYPLAAGAAMFVLMWGDWFLTILQEREMRAHYGEHYQSYPINTIEGHPLLQQAVRERRLIEPKHFLTAIVLSVVVVIWLVYVPYEWREPTLGYVWGLFLIVITTHLGNLIGYRASRRGLHGKLYLHQRTGYLVQTGRYAALAVFLVVLAALTASPFIIGVAVAGLTSALRQLLWLRRVPAIPADGSAARYHGEDRMTTPLRVLVFGAGAIGTYVGGSLALHGHQAVFVEQPDVAARVQAQGLRIEVPGAPPQHIDAHCVGSIGEALAKGPFDVAIFALKSFDTRSALDGLAPHLAALPPFLCLQNGVENEAVLAASLSPQNVIAGSVTTAIGRRAVGDVAVERLRGMGVADGHPLSRRLVDEMDAAGLNARLYPRAADMKWSKLLTNLLANATSAILDMTPAEVFARPGLYRLEIEQMREALGVMAAHGIRVVDLPGTPVRVLAFAVRSLPLPLSHLVLPRAVGGGRGGKMPSFHIDLHAGRGQSEVDYLNGAIVRFGEKVGVPTPINRLLTETLLALTHGEVRLEEFARQPEKLANAWASMPGRLVR